jgi:hypothetical protein
MMRWPQPQALSRYLSSTALVSGACWKLLLEISARATAACATFLPRRGSFAARNILGRLSGGTATLNTIGAI